ncbi:hypothetical protein AJ85_16060 [Alkalihalobacillus alcalophilus ATCC 27647 = CGMCC 1.3604]|uniref:DUF1700 domain-containing protein n=1 Tax=Alkalihalobacillus alcalophilus ATCC 27647 = CGMCC 1.3604 TaxID=1218173 RepID=A0A094XGR6_ALKAL|nr:hypothetical protein [Alkalihalobacillus alcalophilus]KGA97980.1 hypothetical protein BALCAV_0206780 [Alkalihalobacillus alcalophilus ATCC 27647 = CGMCC 1.3604]MED1563982.1 hypothetical protein [Alkalihalobacillus alcalophilus]THG89625.1 hypothetical protein AJ85_16060 [Alkalihalobacillus alcalophilus ATCC 27647 = CGMCC 1.3604]
MNKLQQKYLSDLEEELTSVCDGKEIIKEYQSILDEKSRELMYQGIDEEEAVKRSIEELGQAKDIAACYQKGSKNLNSLKEKMIWGNYLLLFSGFILSVLYHYQPFTPIESIWYALVHMKWFLLVSYGLLWLIISFWIGKLSGAKGKKQIEQVIQLAIVPNLILMFCVLFDEAVQIWFHALITPPFMISCVIVTLLFYPLSKVSFKIGYLKGI